MKSNTILILANAGLAVALGCSVLVSRKWKKVAVSYASQFIGLVQYIESQGLVLETEEDTKSDNVVDFQTYRRRRAAKNPDNGLA